MLAKKGNNSTTAFRLRSSFESALSRNKTEVKILNSNKDYLDTMMFQSIAKLEREESSLSQTYIYMLKKQAVKNEDEMRSDAANRKKLPTKYFELINLKNVDKDNWLLPSLVKSLNDQRLNSYRTLNDIQQRENIKLVRKRANVDNFVQSNHSIGNQNDSHGEDGNLNAPSFSNFTVDSFYLPNLSKARTRSSTSEARPKSSMYNINRFDLQNVKSIRRDRLSAKQMNESYVAKTNMIRIARQFENSTCSKNCKFKLL